MHGKDDWDDVGRHLDVHGGVTFTGTLAYYGEEWPDLWFIGFDCGHFYDRDDIKSVKKYGFGTDVFPHSAGGSAGGSTVKTLRFVKQEVIKLSEQLTPHAMMQAKMENYSGE